MIRCHTDRRGALSRGCKGSVLMEFLLVFPIIILLASMILQFSQIWVARQITAYAAYCATRATLAAGTREVTLGSQSRRDEQWAAQAAAESACAWLCLAGLSSDPSASLSEEKVATGYRKFHNLTAEVDDGDTIYRDTTSAIAAELHIPGWGSVPGSSSRHVRVKTEVLQGGNSGDYAAVRVQFKFPLLFPLAGKMIAWSTSHTTEDLSSYDRASGTWTGGSYYSIHSGWHTVEKKETVMDDSGHAVERSYAAYGEDGKFPFIELTAICVLPRPYTTGKFDAGRYDYTSLGAGGGT